MGTFLLHEEEVGDGTKIVNVVDGQQRMTTSVILIATGLHLNDECKALFQKENPKGLRRCFVHDDEGSGQKFHTILEDEPFFQSEVLRFSRATCRQDSASSQRMQQAKDYFTKHITATEWEDIVRALRTAKVMVYAVNDPEAATQIFELQNDRGKSLTSLEALKSFLMHCIYLHTENKASDRLAALQTQFSKIFRTIEAVAEWKRTPDEDQLLANHCAAFLNWSGSDYSKPKQLVKATIKAMDGAGVIPWIEAFVSSLVESYKTIEELFRKRDELPEFSELLMLDRMGSFWPLILKTWRHDMTPEKRHFRKTCRLLEVFTFRGYAVANLRSDTGLSTFVTAARDFKGNFESLHRDVCKICFDYDLEARFKTGLDNRNFYHAEGSDAHYILWRYENYLRSLPGKMQPLLSWKDFVEPRTYASKLSVEHVAARENPLAETVVAWDAGEAKPFHEVVLDRLGNLVIDSISPNASKGKKDFAGKLKSLSEDSIYLSQGELLNFLADRGALIWDVESIRTRHNHLIAFAQKTWNPNTWHKS